ncbi:hypothetical protein CC2G_009171 [Coprinopsis cinerea AmutBmut pab1-1]|nr:hypothetical protein CC2G_009171 [Coprinopsis cinerea AmutBmut pab1-1]
MAALLSDQIDRLSQRTRSIKSTASQIASGGPDTRLFTHAVLYAQLGDLIRDVDSTEIGLFVLESASSKYEADAQAAQVKRIDFVGATPLRRNPQRRQDRQRDLEPEEYAQAALKCLHRYNDIKPMPRARAQLMDVLERLSATRERIKALQASIQTQQPAAPELPSNKSKLKQEEEAIASLQARIEELNRRKKQLSTSTPAKPLPPVKSPELPTSPEDKFWGTPAEASRALKFAPNLLLDEKADFNDLSDTSFSMPPPQREPAPAPFSRFAPINPIVPEDDVADEPSVVIKAPPEPEPVPEVVVETEKSIMEPDPPIEAPQVEAQSKERSGHIRITPEVDRIVFKIVSIYADVLQLPRSSNAKTVIARLKEVSNETPAPDSPSQSSISAGTNASAVTVQQVLIAYVLYELLAVPGHAMPMNKMKEVLGDKAKSNPGLSVSAFAQNPTRIVYNCVAKRMLKFDRTGKEQIVKFDV